MTFDVEVSGRRHHVEVVRQAVGDHVSIDGRSFASDMAGVAPLWSLLIGDHDGGTDRSPHRSYEVSFDLDESTGVLAVDVDGLTVPVRLADVRRSRARQVRASQFAGEVSVFAPMPGRIVRVLVAPGDEVEARQGLVVMEAMKMENELHAPQAGRVTIVNVRTGSAVEAGARLVVITSGVRDE